jgi:hypothetical protein
MSGIDAWVPAARSAMKLIEQAIGRPTSSLIDDAGKYLSHASSAADLDPLASAGLRKIMATSRSHLDEAARLVQSDASNAAPVMSELRSARFGVDLLLP